MKIPVSLGLFKNQDLGVATRGRLLQATNRRYEEVVVFIPHFGGSHRNCLRHAKLVNELGFDAYVFDLIQNQYPSLLPPMSSHLRYGVRHIWADFIESKLSSLARPKIVYSFSSPGAAALEAIARRRCYDIKAWICDGGPFFQEWKCLWNLFSNSKFRVANPALRVTITNLAYLNFGGIGYRDDMRELLRQLPSGFPILSIRGWQDNLVPPSAIDEFFAQVEHLSYEILSLPEAGHLDGLKKCPQDYRPRLERFLHRWGTALNS